MDTSGQLFVQVVDRGLEHPRRRDVVYNVQRSAALMAVRLCGAAELLSDCACSQAGRKDLDCGEEGIILRDC